MTECNPGEADLGDFRDAAERSQAAGIADESASYVNAATERADASENPQDEPKTGEEDPRAEVGTDNIDAGADAFARAQREDAVEGSDSIEPGFIPGSAEDIEVAGVTGPGPNA